MPASTHSKTAKPANGAAVQLKTNGRRSLSIPCPHLGIAGDPATAFAYPTPDNGCFCKPAAGMPAPIELQHQTSYCLTARYSACPIFQEAENGTLASASAATKRWRGRSRTVARKGATLLAAPLTGVTGRRLRAITLLLLIITALIYFGRDGLPISGAAFTGGVSGAAPTMPAQASATGEPLVLLDDNTATPPPTPSKTLTIQASSPKPAPSATASSVSSPLPTITLTPSATATPTPSASPTVEPTENVITCGPPAGWDTYIVQAGENLFRISLRYNTSMSQLVQANCLTSTYVYAGQRLHVPFHLPPASTATPVPSASATPATTEAPPPQPTNPPPAPTNPPPPPPASPTPPTIEPPDPTPSATHQPPTATPALERLTPTPEPTTDPGTTQSQGDL